MHAVRNTHVYAHMHTQRLSSPRLPCAGTDLLHLANVCVTCFCDTALWPPTSSGRGKRPKLLRRLPFHASSAQAEPVFHLV